MDSWGRWIPGLSDAFSIRKVVSGEQTSRR
jgi:hypothetical protein